MKMEEMLDRMNKVEEVIRELGPNRNYISVNVSNVSDVPCVQISGGDGLTADKEEDAKFCMMESVMCTARKNGVDVIWFMHMNIGGYNGDDLRDNGSSD